MTVVAARMRIQPATLADIPALTRLIADSARRLGSDFYTTAQIDAAIRHVFGVDSELIADGTYLIAVDEAGELAGCGGWSRRATLFGGDRFSGRMPGLLVSGTDPARIRAFFVDPGHARRGVASRLLAACETMARSAGFTGFTLMATLSGVPFYSARGYVAATPLKIDAGGIEIRFTPMSKSIVELIP